MSLDEFDIEHFLKVVRREHRAEPLLLFRRHARRDEGIFDYLFSSRNTPSKQCNSLNLVVLQQLRLESAIVVEKVEAKVDHDDLILVKSEFFVVDVMQLLVHDPDADDE